MRELPRRMELDSLETMSRRLGDVTSINVMRHTITTIAAHWHDYYEFVYVLSGESTHIRNGVAELVREGDAFLLGPADIHAYTHLGDHRMTCYNVAIDPVLVERGIDGSFDLELLQQSAVVRPQRVDVWIEELSREASGARPGRDKLMRALLDCVLLDFARALPAVDVGQPTARDDDLRRAMLFIDRSFRQPLTLAEAAGHASLSPQHFSERFRQYSGTTFQTFLQRRRLQFARTLLRSTSLGVAQVATAAGFGDVTHFGRAFRVRYGRTPTEDRRAVASYPDH